MIEIAAVLSAIVGHWPDFFIILLLLISNAFVGFWEEHEAGNAIAALKAKLSVRARVKRHGQWITIASRELVPGDLIRLRLGDIVPADARLLDGDPVEVDQSALTGESLPTERKSGEAIYSGSILRQGEVSAIVYATGSKTYFGKTAQLVQTGQTVSHFQKAVLKIWQLSNCPGFGACNANYCRCDHPRGSHPYNLAVRLGVDSSGDSCRHADGSFGHNGRWSPIACQETGDRKQIGCNRRVSRCRRSLRG